MPLPSSLALTTIADGSTIVAADHRNNYTAIQTNVNQSLGVLGGAWTAYSPVWSTSGTAPALGNGALGGGYWQVGKFVVAKLTFVPGSTTTFGTGNFYFSFPVTAGGALVVAIGSGWVLDLSANSLWTVTPSALDSGKFQIFFTGATGSFTVGQTLPMTWATGDTFQCTFAYEAA